VEWSGLQLFRAIIIGLPTFGCVRHKTAEAWVAFTSNPYWQRGAAGAVYFLGVLKWHAYVM
jgi:hypothetical protein